MVLILSFQNKDLFFKDGVRRIDYVFAYPKEENAEKEMLKKRQERRDIFEANLTKVGIELERETVEVSSYILILPTFLWKLSQVFIFIVDNLFHFYLHN